MVESIIWIVIARALRIASVILTAFWYLSATAATYTNASTTFNWIDSTAHAKVGYNTTPYKFNGTGCGTAPPTLDDTISDAIPIGFTFLYGNASYTTLQIMSNGRLQFGNPTCGFGTTNIGPPQTYPYNYPDASMNNTMKVFEVDLDPTNLTDIPNYPAASSKTSCNSYANCYVSYASIGTAPNRQFVVTWKNVPEWVTASNTSGSFNLQVILNENGTFVYQYGNIVHGGTGSAQIGWQLSTTDYSVLTFGASAEPPANTAILFYIPSANPLVEYRFEDGAWASGVAGQVTDSSGSGLSGTAIGAAQETSSGKVCRGASIPANSTTPVSGIKTGVRFSDIGVNMDGQGTIMLWYQSIPAWSGSGAQAAQLLDATLSNGQWFSLTKTATGTLYFQVTDSTGVSRSVETTAQSFAAGTWVHIAISWNFNALPATNSDHLQILINGGTPTTSSFTSNGNLTSSLDYVYVGGNPSGLTGTKGTVNSANGTIDELRFYNNELNQGQVLGASSQTHACPTFIIDHLELRHSSWAGIVCAPSTMTVVACSNASCSSLYTSGLVATLSATGVSTIWDSTAGGTTIVIPNGQSSAVRNFYNAAGTSTFSVAGTGIPVTETNPKKCNGTSGSCNWTSANDGLLLTVPNSGIITGGKPAAISVQGVHSSGPTPGAACLPIAALSGSGLKVWSSPVIPASFSSTAISAGVTVGGAPQAANASGGTYIYTPSSLPVSNNVTSLNFDSNATTTLWLKHMDTGQFNLSATLNAAATNTTPAITLNGTASVIATPVGYGITANTVTAPTTTQTNCASGPSASCDSAAGANAKVAAAGDIFSSTVMAVLWTFDGDIDLTDNPIAPNYTGSVMLMPVLMAPSGGNFGALNTTSTTLAAGSKVIASQSWTQAGAMRISASGTYLGQPITGQSGVLGRFSPHHLVTVVTQQGCSTFTYSGQPITIVTVNAMDGASPSGITPNYSGAFARTMTLLDGNGSTTGSFSANLIAAANFSAGIATNAPVFTFTSTKTAPIILALRASDGEASSSGFVEGSAGIRSGRVHLQNAYGSELLDLPVTMRAEYWNNSAWVINSADSCTGNTTQGISNAVTLALTNITLNPSKTCVCDTASPGLSGAGCTTASISSERYKEGATPGIGFIGDFNTWLKAPGSGNSGAVGITATVPSWLRYNWSGSVTNPSSRATFGIYKTPIIYMRENY